MYDELREGAIQRAVRSGALVRHDVRLERGEQHVRRLWLRPNVVGKLSPTDVDLDQLARVNAALKRFVVGGQFNIVSKACANPGAVGLADIRELKTDPPPFVEMRFKPPKHHLRIFGRFISCDGLILTSLAMKSSKDSETNKSLSVGDERKRCDDFFKIQQFDFDWLPTNIETSVSNAKII
ncbi:hypothetical protein AB7M49_008173 [Bradyrhizobium elkanii]